MGASGLLLSLQNTSSVNEGGDVRLKMEHENNYDKRLQVQGTRTCPIFIGSSEQTVMSGATMRTSLTTTGRGKRIRSTWRACGGRREGVMVCTKWNPAAIPARAGQIVALAGVRGRLGAKTNLTSFVVECLAEEELATTHVAAPVIDRCAPIGNCTNDVARFSKSKNTEQDGSSVETVRSSGSSHSKDSQNYRTHALVFHT